MTREKNKVVPPKASATHHLMRAIENPEDENVQSTSSTDNSERNSRTKRERTKVFHELIFNNTILAISDISRAPLSLLCDATIAQNWLADRNLPFIQTVCLIVMEGFITDEKSYLSDLVSMIRPSVNSDATIGDAEHSSSNIDDLLIYESVHFDSNACKSPDDIYRNFFFHKFAKIQTKVLPRIAIVKYLSAQYCPIIGQPRPAFLFQSLEVETNTSPTTTKSAGKISRLPTLWQCHPFDLLLPYSELINHGYPLVSTSSSQLLASQVENLSLSNSSLLPMFSRSFSPSVLHTASPRPESAHSHSCIVAIDCEMCETEFGKELSRISVVDFFTHSVLYDTLVRPRGTITDYLTQYSGITQRQLANCDVTLEGDVHPTLFSKFLFEDTIVIGHSLEYDLIALKIAHEKVIDTAVVYPHPVRSTRKQSLRSLTEKHLNRKIQQSASGHDSVEDAIACVELVKLKLIHGEHYGNSSVHRHKGTILRHLVRNGVQCSVVDSPERVAKFIPSCSLGARKSENSARGSENSTTVRGSVDGIAAPNDAQVVQQLAALLRGCCSKDVKDAEGEDNSGIQRPGDTHFIWGGIHGTNPTDIPQTLYPALEAAPKDTVFMFFGYPDNSSLREQSSVCSTKSEGDSPSKSSGFLAFWAKP